MSTDLDNIYASKLTAYPLPPRAFRPYGYPDTAPVVDWDTPTPESQAKAVLDKLEEGLYVSAPEPEPVESISMGGSYFRYDIEEHRFNNAVEALSDVDYDTIAVTGLSGVMFGTELARRTGKHLLVIRKPDDRSTHDMCRTVGTLGKRWIFVDDLISSGRTRRRVTEEIYEVCKEAGFLSDYVGTYTYSGYGDGLVLGGNPMGDSE